MSIAPGQVKSALFPLVDRTNLTFPIVNRRNPEFNMRKKRHKTGLWVALVLLIGIAVCVFTPVRNLFNETLLVQGVQAVGPYGGLLFVAIFTVITSLGFPGNVMTVIGGALFGLVWGTLWSVFGATFGAIGAFWLGRYFLHDWVQEQFGHHPLLRRLQTSIRHQPFNFVLAIRFTPISPFSLVNFLFGLTPLRLKTYALGTFLGIIPSSITYAWIGFSGKKALNGGDRLSLFLALGFLALLSLVPMVIKPRRRHQRGRSIQMFERSLPPDKQPEEQLEEINCASLVDRH